MGTSKNHPELTTSIDVGAVSSPPVVAAPTRAPAAPVDVPRLLHDLLRVNVEQLKTLREISQQNALQLELMQRNEDRFLKQQSMQRDEFLRWFDEHPELGSRLRHAEEAVRAVLGRAVNDLVEYASDNVDDLVDSDYLRGEMVDRYGTLLNHMSAMYSMLKRMSLVEQSQQDAGSSNPGGAT